MPASLGFLIPIFLAATLLADPSDQRLPIPSDAAQKAAFELVNEILGKEIEKAKSPEEKFALCDKLLELGKAETSAERGYAVLRTGHDLALTTGDGELVITFVDELTTRFQLEPIAVKSYAWKQLARHVRTTQERLAYVNLGIEIVDEIADQRDYETASSLAESLVTVARQSRDVATVKAAVEQSKHIDTAAEAFKKYSQALQTLAATPTDAEANQTVGEFYCFVESHWLDGLPYLAKGKDPSLKQVAEMELAEPVSGKEKLDLAEAWFAIGENATEFAESKNRRAATWYHAALPDLTGFQELKAQNRLKSLPPPGKLELPPLDLKGTYRIVALANDKTLHVNEYGDKLTSTRYQTDDDFSKFVFEQLDDESYHIKVVATRNFIRITGQMATTREQTDDDFSRFILEQQPDKSIRIKSKGNGRYLYVDAVGDQLLSTRAEVEDKSTHFRFVESKKK